MNISRISSVSRPLLLVSTLALGASTVTGCHFWNRLWGKDTVDLAKADVQVDERRHPQGAEDHLPARAGPDGRLRRGHPRGRQGEEERRDVGRARQRQQERQARLRRLRLPLRAGRVRRGGVVRAQRRACSRPTDKEFEIKTVYKKRPDKFSFTTKYKPDYQCIKGGGKSGQAGTPGSSGPRGQRGARRAARLRLAGGRQRHPRRRRAARAATAPTAAPARTSRRSPRW